jgi:putative transposase
MREGWRGYLWQGRFASVALDEPHLMACARYVELNPVRARLVEQPRQWPWSSAAAHLDGLDDGLVSVRPMLDRQADWPALLALGLSPAEHAALRRGERTGRPLGSPTFVEGLERQLGRTLAPQRPGPKSKKDASRGG